MIESYLTVGGTEVVNHTRVQAYIDNGLVSGWDHLEACACSTITAAALGQTYSSPETDPAPWYDAAVPESAEFSGLLVLSMDGIDNRPTRRNVSQSVTGGGVFSRQRVVPRTIVVQAVLLGSSCCGVAYGLKWLGQALEGCPGGGCDGADAVMISCCPAEEPTPSEVTLELSRTYRRVGLVSGPDVTNRHGDGCGAGCSADIVFVEFILSAAEPWAWTPLTEAISEAVPTDDGSECIEWTLADFVDEGCPDPAECCRLAACADDETCADPECQPPPPPTISGGASCFCLPVAVNRACYELDTSSLPASSQWVPTITLDAGSQDLRRVTVTFYDTTDFIGDCDAAADELRCSPAAVYFAGFVPSGEEMVFDGQIRRTFVTCDGEMQPAFDAWGRNGSPVDFTPLGCGRTYCVCFEADALFTPAANATITLEISAREA